MRTRLIVATAVVVLAALVGTLAYARLDNPEGAPYMNATVTAEDLVELSEARVFFAHQSVGVNVLDGVAAVYTEHDLLPLPVAEVTADDHVGAGLSHIRIGENGDPIGKIEAFDAMLRAGLGDQVDVAILKLCYSDIRAGDDIDTVFTTYRDTLAALRQDYPGVTFVAATVPLNVKRDTVAVVKGWLGRGDKYGPEHNALREELNAMLREEYASSGLLFDVAAIESTAPDGDRITGRHDGKLYYALDRAYASDRGHLNAAGAQAAAEGFLAVLAEAARR